MPQEPNSSEKVEESSDSDIISQNSSEEVEESSDSDVISQLPDEVLCTILSLVDISEAVSTCVLSTRWKNVWRSIPKLRFDDSLPPFSISNHTSNFHNSEEFSIFVDKVLILHNNMQFIREFYLKCVRIRDECDIGAWISNVIMKGIKIIDFEVVCHNPKFHFPSSIFTCETLEVLRLGGLYISVPDRCCLPRLRTMELNNVSFYCGCISSLISACPTLESLDIKELDYYDEIVNISSPSLRMLNFFSRAEYELEIDCPALQSLSISSNDVNGLTISSYYLYVGLDTSIFTSNTLEVLVLEHVSLVGSPTEICLPKLKSLRLGSIRCEDDECVSNLISSCTSLESLDIIRKGSDDVIAFTISSTTLRVLNIQNRLGDKRGFKLVLNVPALQFLGLRDLAMEDDLIGDLFSLEEASIKSSTCISTYQAIRSVKTLSIEANSLSAIIPEHGLPMFPRLTVLKLKARCCQWKMLQEFIKNSDKLEDLTIVMPHSGNDKHGICWGDFQSVPRCLMSSLRTMSIGGIRSLEDELAMVKYILKHSRLLRTMKIEISRIVGDKTKNELLQKLLGFSRGYEKCKILISDVS